VEANAWSTASVVWGEDAPGNLASRGVPARLVGANGDVVRCGGWPSDPVDLDLEPSSAIRGLGVVH
jgi:thiamine biosynthesis lipoprotein